MKESDIWEEKNLTEPSKKSDNNGESDECDTTVNIENSNNNGASTDTTKISGVYKIVNKINGKYYVGSSNDIIKTRWKKHRYMLRKNKHSNPKLQNAWNKYGEENFEFIIVEKCLINELLVIEQRYLDTAKSYIDSCYNIEFLAKIPLDKIRRKISCGCKGENNAMFGKHHTKESNEKNRKAKLKNPSKFWLDKHRSKETKEKISKCKTGKKMTKEYCQNLSVRMLGNKHLLGHKHSEETRKKMSESRKRFVEDQRIRSALAITVAQ